MTAFATAAAGPLRADPSKRVNYTLGLVLGVDEFQQEQLYHRAGRWRHNQWLHGYGTVWGLQVSTPDPADADPEIRVTEGAAVDPCGRDICVPATMCVRLNAWLDRHREVLQRLYGAGPATIPLAVVLCHRECPDDVVPVPGEPCRSQDDAMQPSRIRESFELRLALRDEAPWDSPPGDNPGGLTQFRFSQPEEEAVRAFGRLLDRVRVEGGGPGGGREALVAAVRALDVGDGWLLPGSPPGEGDGFVLDEGEAGAAIREAVRVWATEVRPRVRAAEPVRDACGYLAQEDCCVLLAEVDLPVAPGWRVAGNPFPADEERRPVLLHTRLLQEWLTHAGGDCCSGQVDTFATAAPIALDTVRLWLHHEAALDLPADAVTVVVNGGALVAPGSVTAVGGMDNAFDVVLSPGAADGDTVELRLDLAQITDAGSAPAGVGGDRPSGGLLDRHGPEVRAYVVFREQATVLPSLGGDVTGPVGSNTVERIQGQRVSPTAPAANGQVLTWSTARRRWEPAAPATGGTAGGDVAGPLADLTVTRIQRQPVSDAAPTAAGQFLVWNGTTWQASAGPAATGQLLAWRRDEATGGGQWAATDQPTRAGQSLVWTVDPATNAGSWRPRFAVQAPGGVYRIVAAGNFEVREIPGRATPLGDAYNATVVEMIEPSTRQRIITMRVTFGRGEVPAGSYVVKGTAWDTETMQVVPLLSQGSSAEGVLVAASLAGTEMQRIDRLTIEINRIG
ncbi:MAG TPA: hypothetical protein VF584_20615 [Longimicrobium sp.]|jgi:hypothetical protein